MTNKDELVEFGLNLDFKVRRDHWNKILRVQRQEYLQ